MPPKEMTPKEFVELTHAMDTYNYENEDLITPQSLHAKWWPLLNQLRQATNKETLIDDWKYKVNLESVEYSHASNMNRHITLDDWEQRFVLDLWISIYH